MSNDKKEYFVAPNSLVSVPPLKTDSLSGNVKNHAGSILNQIGILDKIPPHISLNGSSTVNIVQGETYIELGANWTDTIDGGGLISTITGTVNTAVVGTYIIRYSKTDTVGNTSSICRTVNVIAPIDPMLIGPALQNVTISDFGGGSPITPINAGGVIDPLKRTINYSSPDLPSGLDINSSTGVISGMYDANGTETFNITVKATPAGGSNSLMRSFILSIVDQG